MCGECMGAQFEVLPRVTGFCVVNRAGDIGMELHPILRVVNDLKTSFQSSSIPTLNTYQKHHQKLTFQLLCCSLLQGTIQSSYAVF